MQKVLIIEDEKEIAKIQKDYLEKAGYTVLLAINGEEGLNDFYKVNPDIVILDLNIPKLDGYEVCKRIRKDSGVPIIMVTAKTKEIDELLGLEVGADDYVKKPFSPNVLVSRVKSLLKRPSLVDNENAVLSLGNIKVNTAKRIVIKNNHTLPFTTIQFNIFLQLLYDPGKVFSRDELMDRSYNDNDLPDIFDRTIDSHIKNIRKLIEENPKDPKYIITVRGVGYKFNEVY